MTYTASKFEVATSNGLLGDIFTRNVTDGRTDRLWYEINIHYFSKEKGGYNYAIYLFLSFYNQNVLKYNINQYFSPLSLVNTQSICGSTKDGMA